MESVSKCNGESVGRRNYSLETECCKLARVVRKLHVRLKLYILWERKLCELNKKYFAENYISDLIRSYGDFADIFF